MGRRLAAVALLATSGAFLALAASAGVQATTGTSAKTTTPTPTNATAATTTTLWPSTTAVRPAATTVPAATTSTALAPSTTVFPPTVAGDPFDGFTLLRDFYGRLGVDPFSAADLVDQAAPGSTAEAFLYHEIGAAIAIFDHTSDPLPAYTVTQTGPSVSVCRDDGVCETFGDFVAVAGALDTLTLDGQPMDDRAGSYQRLTTVETLTLDASFGVRRPRDELLSVVALLTAEGGGTTFAWEQTAYVDATGEQLPIDVATSLYPVRIEDGDFGVAHLLIPGATDDGQLVVPITTDLTGVPTTIRVPVLLLR